MMNRKILVVDPDPIQLNIVEKELTDAGFEVIGAENAEQALVRFAEHQPMLSIVEINLPDRPGTQLCQQLKTDPDLPGGLVVLVSAGVKDVTSVAEATLRFRSDFYLDKPFQVASLIWKSHELINGRLVGRVSPDGRPVPFGSGELAFTTDSAVASQRGFVVDVDPATLLMSFFLHRRSGSLLLISGDDVRQFVFQEGFPIAADSNVHGEEYGSLAVAIGTCEGGDMVRARGAWQSIDRHLGVIAVSMGLMGARDHFRTMRLHLESVISGALALRDGEYFLEYGAMPEHFDGVALAELPPHYAIEGIRARYDDAQCLRRLGLRSTMITSDAAHFIIRELDDVPYYENVLGMFTRPASVGQIMELGRVQLDDGLLQTILGLRTIGALWVTDDSPAVCLEDVEPETIARDVELNFSRKKKKRRKKKKVPATAAPATTTPATASPVTAGEASIGRVKPARRFAAGRPVKEKYRGEVSFDPLEMARRRKAQPRRMTREELAASPGEDTAEKRFERGAQLFGRADYSTAIGEFEAAIAMQPSRATYHVFLAQCILLLPKREPDHLYRAVECLKRAIQINPRKGDPFHLLGVALVELDRKDEATFALRKALQLGTSHRKETRRLLETIT
jgi:DNA-binding response OmpR family regulator/tetratricopeptide (TPR) repeat protein